MFMLSRPLDRITSAAESGRGFNSVKKVSPHGIEIGRAMRVFTLALNLAAGIAVGAATVGCAHATEADFRDYQNYASGGGGAGGAGGADTDTNTHSGVTTTTSTFSFGEDTNENCPILNEVRLCHPDSEFIVYSDESSMSACDPGFQVCLSEYKWSECWGFTKPELEKCSSILDSEDGSDNDCDGLKDEQEGCVCKVGEEVPCYEYGDDKAGVGICQMGTKTCSPTGKSWNSCIGQVAPKPKEICALYDENGQPIGPSQDEDCNGKADLNDGCCIPDSTAYCYTGPAGTDGVGPCTGGTMFCSNTGEKYGSCYAQVLPKPETCNVEDDDCDGGTDEEGCQ